MAKLHKNSKRNEKKKILLIYVQFLSVRKKKGYVAKVRLVSPKKPNSAKRKVARVRLSNRFMVTAKIKGQGHNLQGYSQVFVCGGRANDLIGVRYNMIKGKLSFSWKERSLRMKGRSKYGMGFEDLLLALQNQGTDHNDSILKKKKKILI